MADPLLGSQQYIAEWDFDTDDLWLTGTSPGPAGSLELELDGVSVTLDAADPSAVNSVRVSNASGLTQNSTVRGLLDRLIGPNVTDDAAEVLTPAAGVRRRIGDIANTRRSSTRLNPVVARLATAMSAADSPGLLIWERALAQVEAATLIHRLELDGHVRNFPVLLADSAAILADVSDDADDMHALSDSLAGESRRMAADICEEGARLLDDRALAAQLETFANRLRSETPNGTFLEPQMAAAMRAPLQTKGQSPERPADVVVSLVSAPLGGSDPSITRTSHDEYEVRLPGWAERADGWWVRAFSGVDSVPLAVVAMHDDGGDAVAYFLATERDVASLVIDIVDDPGEPRPSQQIAAFKAAIAIGKRAAQLERLDRRAEAVRAWQRSSDMHANAGDEWRSNTAAAIAKQHFNTTQGPRVLRVRPVVADFLGPRT